MEIVNQLDEDRWRAFVDKHPQGNIFQTPEMFAVFSRTQGYHPSLWAAVEGDEILALHLPVQITLMEGWLAPLTTRAVDFGSVLVENSHRGLDTLDQLMEQYDRQVNNAFLFTELRNYADLTSLQVVLKKHGYHFQDYQDYLIDLHHSLDEILQSFAHDTRRRIRQFERSGEVVVREVTDKAQLLPFYHLLEKTYRRARVPLAHISLFNAAFEILAPLHMADFAMAYVNDVPAAAGVVLHYRDSSFGWYNGTDRDVRPPSSNEYLIWELISKSADRGSLVMDFGGAGKPGEKYGVRDFKAKFHGRLVNYGRNTRIHAPILAKISQISYELLRRVIPGFDRRDRFMQLPERVSVAGGPDNRNDSGQAGIAAQTANKDGLN